MKWTDEELKKLAEIYPNNPSREVAKILGRTVTSVKSKANVLGIKKDPDFNYMAHSKSATSKKTKLFIRDNYKKYTNHDLAKLTDVSESTVQKVRREYNLEKENSGCFEPGQEAFNKGMKQSEFMSPQAIERTKRTRFKKGTVPPNTKWDGALSIRNHKSEKTSYMYIRLTKSKWVLYHRHQWEKKNGLIPKGMILRSRDGNTLNCDPDNWELITRKEHAARNINPEKAVAALKKFYKEHGHPAVDLHDSYVAGHLAGGDKELREYLIEHRQDLIRIARKRYLLNRELKQIEDEQNK